jgi:hypothetical protein
VQDFWDENGKGILVAVLVGIIAKIAHSLWQFVWNIWRTRQSFGISGNWIGTCDLPSYGGDSNIEIWRYIRAGDEVKLTFFAYGKTAPGAIKWRGHGVFRNNKLSAYYYELDKTSYDSGVIVMEMKGARLTGTYAQFDSHSPDESFFVSDRSYVQARVSLPLTLRARMWVGLPPVRTYAEAAKLLLGARSAAKPQTQAAT